jgi:hypothetical protein
MSTAFSTVRGIRLVLSVAAITVALVAFGGHAILMWAVLDGLELPPPFSMVSNVGAAALLLSMLVGVLVAVTAAGTWLFVVQVAMSLVGLACLGVTVAVADAVADEAAYRVEVLHGRVQRLEETSRASGPDDAQLRADPEDERLREVHAAALERQTDETLDALLKTLPMMDGRYLFEGDLLFTREEVAKALRVRREEWLLDNGRSRSLSNTLFTTAFEAQIAVRREITGQDDMWPRGQRNLSFAVHRASFGQHADRVTLYARAAALAWEDMCERSECGISFTLSSESHQKPGPVTFVLRHDPGNYAAVAFYPSWKSEHRYVRLGDDALRPDADVVGILKHEFGHVLGYDHEHERAPDLAETVNACKREKTRWRDLTPYDPNSVMHFFCGEKDSATFAMTASDIEGHKKLYGANTPPK